MKKGDIVERNGEQYVVTRVFTLGGGEAFETELYLPFNEEEPVEEEPVEEEPKKKRTRAKK